MLVSKVVGITVLCQLIFIGSVALIFLIFRIYDMWNRYRPLTQLIAVNF